MTEVAEAGQPRSALAEDRGGHPHVEAGRREAVRALDDEELDDGRADEGEP